MSFLVFDGFEHNSLSEWDENSGIAVQSTQARTGTYGMQIYRTGWLRKYFSSPSATGVIFGFAFYDPGGAASRRIAGPWGSSGYHGGIGYNAGTNKFYIASYFGSVVQYATNAINDDTWYYVECKVIVGQSGSGSVEILVDGDQEAYEAANDYQNGAADLVSAAIGSSSNSNEYCYFDDMYILVLDGVDTVAYQGDIIVHAGSPDADGTTGDWTRSGGSTDYENIDEGDPNNDTDYLYTAAGSDIVLVSVDSFSDVGREIVAVQETLHLKKNAPGLALGCFPLCRSGGTNYEDTEVVPVLGYLPYHSIREKDPDTDSAWALSALNSAEWGVKTNVGPYTINISDDLDNWDDDPGTPTLG